MIRILGLLSLCLALACSGGPAADAGGAPPEESAAAPAPGPTPDVPSDPAAQAPPAADAVPAAGGLPEPAVACATDADCVVTLEFRRTEAGQCCRGCSPVAGNKAWHESVTAACESMGSEGCKPKRCAPLPGVACDGGRCAIRGL